MTNPCLLCGKRKAQRRCARQGNADICSLCCAETRDTGCGECGHYTIAQQYRAAHRAPAIRPDGHFIAEINPEVEQAVNDALELAQNGKTDQAWAAVTDLLRKHPENHTACYGMGTLHAIKGEHKEAIKWFDKATAIFPYFVEAHFNKAVAYQKQLDVGNTIRAYRKVVEMGDPKEPEVNQAQSFLDAMSDTIRRNEGMDLDAYLESQTEFDRAFSLMERGEWLSALDGFRAVIAKNDRNAPTHGNLGLCHAKLGHKAQALAELDRALEIDPGYEPAMLNRIAVERMEEGHPMTVSAFKSVEFSKERLQRKTSGRGSFSSRFATWFTERRRRSASGSDDSPMDP